MIDIPLNIKKTNVNDFLEFLWDRFSKEIGPVACQHFYIETGDPQVYIYDVNWAHRTLPFSASMQFYNHTNKGIYRVVLDVTYENTSINGDHEKAIADIIKDANKIDLHTVINARRIYFPVRSKYHFGCDYFFPESNLGITSINGVLYFYFSVEYISKSQLDMYLLERVKLTCAIFTLVTQHLFEYEPNNKIYCTDIDNNTIKENHFIDKDGFVDADEIIKNDKLYLPREANKIISAIVRDDKNKNSALRFAESIKLRHEVEHDRIHNLFKIQYELLGYVSAIESLLDTTEQTITVACNNCGATIDKTQRKITNKFNDFVKTHSLNKKSVMTAMKDLYNDRSKFVHMGESLTKSNTMGSKPLLLEGKSYNIGFPYYYLNIHEFTGYLLRSSMSQPNINS